MQQAPLRLAVLRVGSTQVASTPLTGEFSTECTDAASPCITEHSCTYRCIAIRVDTLKLFSLPAHCTTVPLLTTLDPALLGLRRSLFTKELHRSHWGKDAPGLS